MTSAVAAPVTPTVIRRPVPRVRRGYRIDIQIGGTDFSVTVNVHDGRVVELDLGHNKHGSFGNGVLETIAHLLSTALAYGMPLEEFVASYINSRFEPSGMTFGDPEIRQTSSIMDYLARRLALDFLTEERQTTLGVHERRSAAAA